MGAPPRFNPAAEVWHDICPWCGQWEAHQVGKELPEKVVVWCRTCSGSSLLLRGADFLVPRTPPKPLHDKRRQNGTRLPKQVAPVLAPVSRANPRPLVESRSRKRGTG